MPDASILQIDGVHQMMQRDVRIASAQASKQRRREAAEGNEGIVAERAEQEIEPNDIGLALVNGPDQAENTARIVERPAALHLEALALLMRIRKFVRENGQAKEWVALQFLRDMKSVFA